MINNIFENLCNNIELDEETVLNILKIKKELTKCITEYYDSSVTEKNSQFIGSFGRNTAVYIENIRLLLAIPSIIYAQISVNINDILKNIKTALIHKFSTCEFSDNGNGLNVNIDGNLSFEIVPGFMFEEGTYIYLCNNQWKNLNLANERRIFNEINLKNNNNLINLCRMLKIWKFENDLDIGNILLDTFAYHFFNLYAQKVYTYDIYDEMIRDFFKFLLDNCNNNNFISFDGQTILKRRTDISSCVFNSLSLTQTALISANCQMYKEAIQNWTKIFGTFYFTI